MVIAGAISGCQSGKESGTAELAPISVDSVSFKQESTPYITKDGDTLISSIDIVYPKLMGGNDSVIAKINAYMAELPVKGLGGIIDPEGNPEMNTSKNLDVAAKAFFTSVADAQKEMPDVPTMVYTYEALGDTVLISPSVISLYYNDYCHIY